MDEDVIKSEIEQGVAQVDSSLTVNEFVCDFDKDNRRLKVFFTARNSDNETVEIGNSWG